MRSYRIKPFFTFGGQRLVVYPAAPVFSEFYNIWQNIWFPIHESPDISPNRANIN